MGNRIKRILNGKEEVYHYNNKNQLLQIEKENDTIFYKYDNQGNTLEEKSSKGTTTYTYDIYNRTKEVITETGDHIKNSYTPLGLRYKKEVNGVVSRYIVDDWNIIAEVDKENNVKSREIRGYELLKKEVENEDYFYHTNEHGDIVYLTNEKEEIENSYSYDVFGNIREQKENIENIFKYAGEQLDKETEQYYLRARYYNPTIGRFTQEDVYRDDGLNLYVYVMNNPLLWVDPSGYARKVIPFDLDGLHYDDINAINYYKVLKDYVGEPPKDMVNPHAHHIVFKNGNGEEQKKLVKELQNMLWNNYQIDPIKGKEVLVWAQNQGVKGQHGIEPLKNIHEDLMKAHKEKGTKEEIIKVLDKHKDLAANRNQNEKGKCK